MTKVVVDYGHGGTDPGAVSGNLREKDLVIQIGRKITAILRKQGVRVVETRTNDTFITLSKRTSIANSAKVDLFVSVHINSASSSDANGVETFSHPNSSAGAKLAKLIQDELVNTNLFKTNRGVKKANFHVLRVSRMPAALVELGFIKNAHDAKIMTQNQNQLAQAVANGILKHLGKSKVTTGSTNKTGWIKNNVGWWYRNTDGTYPSNQWQKINGTWYLFDKRGYMLTGWQKLSNTWYYMESSGAMATGWKKVNGKWYYLHTNGAMRTGLITVNGKHYYLERSGALITDESIELEANEHGHLK